NSYPYSQPDIYNHPSQRQNNPQRQASQNQNHQRQVPPHPQQNPNYQRNPQQSQRKIYNNEREYNSDMSSIRSKPQHQNSSSYEKRQPKNKQSESKRSTSKRKSSYTKKAKRQRTMNFGSVIRFILKLIIVLFVLYSTIALIGIFTMDKQKTGERNRTDNAMSASYVDNILIIGTDSRDLTEDSGRSDSMILLSLNSNTNEIYMTSFLRDVYVDINNYGSGKLNSAYSYGGAELLMDTIESNYNIKIDDYVTVSFAACANIIDAVGGVELELSDDEADAVNEILISEVNELMGDGREDDLLSEGGTQKLNGKQALSYSRIRYVGNADFERTSRQRIVMSQVMKKASKNPVSLCRILFSALPEMSTNMSVFKLYGYSFRAPVALLFDDIVQQRIPADDTFHGDTRDGEDVLITTFEENQLILKNTIFKKN
ncbi:MAG: LCP family protein, partial [Ruminococcus sp.]|nr:LCP family protein [Ruminococcus sp.]